MSQYAHNSIEIMCIILFKMDAHADLKTGTSGMKESEKSLHAAAVGLFTLPHLQSLELEGVCLDDAFFVAMTSAAPHAQVLDGLHIQTCQKQAPCTSNANIYTAQTDFIHSFHCM